MWPTQDKRRCIITILSPALLIASRAFAQPDSNLPITQDVAKPSSSIATAEPTCESRTVNYITHTLPQQCLTSAPSAFSTPGSVSATVTPSATDPTSTPSSDADHEEELDADGNDLSTGAFMSFEEWKAMMLEKSGQEALEPRHRKTKETHGDYPADDFDSLGDEGEVSLDFDAYSDKISELASSTKPSQKEKDKERQVEKVSYDEGLAQSYRSKDAGTTCKERFSYASFDAGATIKKANPGAKNPKAILVENKDSYMLLECAMKNKFVIVELSDDILVDTVVIANFEFFSSMLRHFRVSVSDRYPVKEEKWKVLGTFQARNSRNIQPFLVSNPQIWAKYLRLEVLTHYGNEYYCPVSLLRVHGTRMLDSWKEADPADLEVEDDGSKTVSEATEETVEVTEVELEEVEVVKPSHSENQVVNLEQSVFIPYWDKSYFYYKYPFDLTCTVSDAKGFASNANEEHARNTTEAELQSTEPTETTSTVNSGTSSSGAPTTQSSSQAITDSGRTTSPRDSSETSGSTTIENSSESVSSTTSTPDAKSVTATPPATPTTITPPSLAKTATAQSSPKSRTPASTSLKPPSSRSTVVPKGQPSGTPTAPRNKTGTVTTSSPASAPTIQDSFFKALNKRIQALESNTTLSLQYIESQSRFLQEALARLERRQVAKVDLFLDTLNKTVLGELREVRTQYDQIWQSTVIALETQREQSEREIVALSSRLGVLADEVVFQKRMAIVQSVLLLGCLVLVIFSRGGIASVAADAYYPSERFLGAVSPSRLVASPLFPSPPQPRPQPHQHHTHHRPNPDVPLLSVEEASPETRPRRSLSQTTESSSSSLRHRPRRNSRATSTESVSRHPQPSTESAPASSASLFRAATPSSIDMGYDSEPAMTPTRGDENHGSRNGDGEYYATSAEDMAAGKGGMGPSYSEALARKSERQLTPSSDVDGAEYMPMSSRPPLTHSTSARKPLPALPEDPD
ncbi:uncharacterized protein GGS22DRAFT_167002 [Annulohypoxylon maeteangense]|uniref:uncharacterized protein n=1 Tax=Annulohypoxylon maeteangense TaxID=1927788 RepID=UPI002008788C|nr:uncharacterized protein GGS22DRAFT_167002 [Annulohypoxylon maeteangense]KAI0883438.1 hypothetical protein GGS22DRAFT_167002 [Annulohypoxylon maeteangense]